MEVALPVGKLAFSGSENGFVTSVALNSSRRKVFGMTAQRVSSKVFAPSPNCHFDRASACEADTRIWMLFAIFRHIPANSGGSENSK
jgi:hypothetical protein